MNIDKFNKRLAKLGSLADYRPFNGLCRMFIEQCIMNETDIYRDENMICIVCRPKVRKGKRTYIWSVNIDGRDRLVSEETVSDSIKVCFNDVNVVFTFTEK